MERVSESVERRPQAAKAGFTLAQKKDRREAALIVAVAVAIIWVLVGPPLL